MDHTGLYDSDGRGLTIGTVVRKSVTANTDAHGSWAEYEIKQQGMTPILSYKRSEKGQVLPEGYLASLLADEYDAKMFLFTNKLADLRPVERMVVVLCPSGLHHDELRRLDSRRGGIFVRRTLTITESRKTD